MLFVTMLNIRQVYYPGETNFDDYLENNRQTGMKQTVFSSDKVVSDLFVELAGEYADEVIGFFPYNPNVLGTGFDGFMENYRDHFGEDSGWHAVHAYEGTRILINSVQKAGLNRALIRDELTSIKQHSGIAGDIILDDSWNSITPIWLAEFNGNEFKFWEYQWASQSGNN